MPLTVRREHRRGFTVITLTGEVDRNEISRLGADIDMALSSAAPQLLFDLSDMNFIDSAGLRLLASASMKARDHGGTCGLCCLSPTPMKVMMLTGLVAAFDIYPTMAAALDTARC